MSAPRKPPGEMPPKLTKPIVYLITSGETTFQTTPLSKEFFLLLKLVEAAVAAGVDLIQLREKQLHASVLYELATAAVTITSGSRTSVLVNDRADVASAAGAAGVHLTTSSVEALVIRRTFGLEFLIGVSTHSLSEADAARDGGADFVVLGPVFETPGKSAYGEPVGLKNFKQVTASLAPFPVLALGGISLNNAAECLRAGASGVAAIRLMSDPAVLPDVVKTIRAQFEEDQQ